MRIEKTVSILGFCIDVRKKVGYVRRNTRKGVRGVQASGGGGGVGGLRKYGLPKRDLTNQ